MKCYKCGTEIDVESHFRRQETCAKCFSYLHCCYNCSLYDPNAYQECREPQAPWVRDKDKGNFCEYFEPGDSGVSADKSRAEEAKRKLEDLFKKKNDEEEN